LNRCHFDPAGSSSSKLRATPFWLARPTANSITRMGSANTTKNSKYKSTNAAPPYCPTM
jgi:hypothetical protein